MRGKVAKKIRRQIYMAQSLRIQRRYRKLSNGSIINVGLRRAYQLAKKAYKQERRGYA